MASFLPMLIEQIGPKHSQGGHAADRDLTRCMASGAVGKGPLGLATAPAEGQIA